MSEQIGAGSKNSIIGEDYTTEPVPLSERRGPLSLGLLWLTMITGFPAVLAGFEWYKSGITLSQAISCAFVSCMILLAYTIPACWLGAISGQTYSLLSRTLFGRIGSYIVSMSISIISVAWYGLTAYICAASLIGLYHWTIPLPWLAAILAVLMAFNNLFGFTGITAFAGYIAAPVMIFGVVAAFIKAVGMPEVPPPALPLQVENWRALTMVSAFVIGYGAWGNEADYWRYARPKLGGIVIPLVVSIAVGVIFFPLTGWLLARASGITEVTAASALIMNLGYGDQPILAGLVLATASFALNDANLYAAINGVENIKRFSRPRLTISLTVIGALTAALLSGWPKSFEAVASLSSTILPCATVIMLCEWFIFSRLRGRRVDFTIVPDMSSLPVLSWTAVPAMVAGSLVGLFTSGIIEPLEMLHFGVCSLQAWLTSLLVYILLRTVELSVPIKAKQDLVEVSNEECI